MLGRGQAQQTEKTLTSFFIINFYFISQLIFSFTEFFGIPLFFKVTEWVQLFPKGGGGGGGDVQLFPGEVGVKC